jgi:hypothetical protein
MDRFVDVWGGLASSVCTARRALCGGIHAVLVIAVMNV